MWSCLHNIISLNHTYHLYVWNYDELLWCSLFGQFITGVPLRSRSKWNETWSTANAAQIYDFMKTICTWATSWTANYDLKSERKNNGAGFKAKEKSENFKSWANVLVMYPYKNYVKFSNTCPCVCWMEFIFESIQIQWSSPSTLYGPHHRCANTTYVRNDWILNIFRLTYLVQFIQPTTKTDQLQRLSLCIEREVLVVRLVSVSN